MDILPASTKSDWWTVLTDNNPIKGRNLKDNINLPAFETLQAQLAKAKTVPKQIELWQAFLKNPANINEAGMPIAKKALNTWMTDGKMPSNVQAALSKDPLAPLPALAQAQLTYDKTDPASVKNYATALKDTYGNLKKADGTPEFTPAYLDSVAAGTIPQDTFDTRINNIAVKAATADLKAQGISLADVGGAEGLASSGKLAEYLNDSTKLASAYTSTPTAGSTVTGGAGNDTVPNGGITALGPYSGSISEVNTPAKMKQVVDNYDPNKGVYRAPSLDASGNLVANSTSPYSNILNGMLSGYKNPYAADYTNQLKMPETPDLTNIKKSFENNPTSKDLLKLANTAGQPYDPKAITSLSPALSKIYQPSITNSAGQQAKPGAPDTTNTTLPVVPKAGEPIVTDTSAGKVVNPVIPSVTPPAPFTVNSTTSYERDDISPEVRAALDARAITDAKNAIVGDTITANDNLVKGIVSPNIASSLSTNNMNTNVTGVNGEAGIPSVLNPTTTPGKRTFQEDDGVVVSAEDRAKHLEAARIAQEAVAKRQAEEKAEAERQAGLEALAKRQAEEKAEAERQAGLEALANQQAADKIAADKAAIEKQLADKSYLLNLDTSGVQGDTPTAVWNASLSAKRQAEQEADDKKVRDYRAQLERDAQAKATAEAQAKAAIEKQLADKSYLLNLDTSGVQGDTPTAVWNASLSAKRQAESERQDAIAQAATTAVANKATSLGYKGDLTNTAAMQNFIYDSNKTETDRQAALANQQAVEKTVALSNPPSVNAAQQSAANQATVAPNSTSVVPSVSAGTNFTGMSNNIGPQQVTLTPNAVVTPSSINTLSAQNNLGPLNISNLGAVIGPQAMNSNAGGVASLVGPVAPAVQASAVPSTVSSLPKYNAPAQTVINAGTTQVLDSSGTPIPGRRRMTMSR